MYVPDFFDGGHPHFRPLTLGDPVPENIMQKLIPTKEQAANKSMLERTTDAASVVAIMGPWFLKHREAVSLPLVQRFLNELRADPAHKKIGAVGFCWGGRYAILLTHEGAVPFVDAAVAMHPSSLSIPAEIEKIAKPVSIQVGDSDDILKMPDVEKIQRYSRTGRSATLRCIQIKYTVSQSVAT